MKNKEFEIWFSLFIKQITEVHGYKGPLEDDPNVMDLIKQMRDEGQDPEEAADEFYLEENRQD